MKPDLPLAQGRLRPIAEPDLAALKALLHDGEVRRYVCDDEVLPDPVVADMIAQSRARDTQGLGLWVIETAGGHVAGVAGLHPVTAPLDAAPETAGGIEPIIVLVPEYWGRGLACAALGALVAHGFKTLKLDRIVGAVDEPNTRSHAMMQRVGFTVVGRTRGPAHTLILYALNAREQ